jgi:hypothetical protein
MRAKDRLWALIALAILSMSNLLPARAAAGAADRGSAPHFDAQNAALVRVSVDPRVELLSLIFRLAGNPEYTRGRVDSYTADAESQFGTFRDQEVVKLAARLRNTRGVSYDACMSMAVHLTDAYGLQLKIPLTPWPESLDRRWTAESATQFLTAARLFVNETGFRSFFEKHRSLYETAEGRIKTLLEKKGHLDWFDAYFGQRPQATFNVALGMFNGGNCYGPHFRDATGREDLFCILGVWQTDAEGLPEFTENMLDTVVHEFGHSYANPLVDRHQEELRASGQTLFAHVAARMRSQAYSEPSTMLRESLVRACVTRYILQYKGETDAQRAIREEERKGFLWMRELSDVLSQYEAHRDRYPDLESFAPRLVSFFKQYAADFESKQSALEAKRPKVLSLVPPNGETDVDPGLAEIRVTFDRPMKDHSWSMCGAGPHCPEGTGKPKYDARRTTWTFPVKLKPDWDYEFGLNCQSFDAFRSEEGVPLEPVPVAFRTGSLARTDKQGATR